MVFAKTKQAAAKLSAQVKDHSFGKKYYAKVRLPEGKTFEQATGHEKTGTLQDWIQFEPKENKSCVIEQKQRENEREDIRQTGSGCNCRNHGIQQRHKIRYRKRYLIIR